MADEPPRVAAFTFEARCCRSRNDGGGKPVAGFQITDISKSGLAYLGELIRLLTVCD